MKLAAYALALAALAAGLALRLRGGGERPRPPARVSGRSWSLIRPAEKLPDECDTVFRLRLAGEADSARAEFSRDAGGSCYYAELTPGRLALVKAVRGRETVLHAEPVELRADREHRVRIVRRKGLAALVVDEELRCLVRDDELSGGRLILGGSSERTAFSAVEVLPAESEFAFGDDFMRAEGQRSAWRELGGSWRIRSLRNPLLSANAFSYEARGEKCLALAGSRTWAEYDFEASLEGPPGGRVGIVFAARGPKDHMLFSWGARAEGRKELCVVRDGRAELLASAPGGYIPGVWYRARAELNMGRARVLLDGRLLFDVSSARIAGGEVGLWADSAEPARFDDVIVTAREGVSDAFSPPLAARWRLLGGDWEAREGLRVRAPRGAKALWGGGSCRNVEVRCRADGAKGEAGLVLAYADELNHVLFSWPLGGGVARLVLVEGGKRSVLDERACRGGPAHLSASTERGHVSCEFPGGTLEGWSGELREGRAGVWARGPRVSFGEFELRRRRKPPQLLGRNTVFRAEREMSLWADPAKDWRENTPPEAGSPWWHRGRFPGDCELVLGVGRELKTAFDVALSVSKADRGAGAERHNGYVFKLSVDRDSGDAAGVELYREGEKVASGGTELKEPLRSLSLRRAGSFAVGAVNDRDLLVFRDRRPPSGSRVAWSAEGVEAAPADAKVFSGRVWDYDFSRAPVDWRAGAGIWEVTKRWESDHRWTFFSGRPEREEKLAVLWNKRSFRGEVSAELWAAIKMEPFRGRRFDYARDINITLCADGTDLTSGYSFLFGGFDDGKTCILRKGKVVASTDEGLIPRSNRIFRSWFYLRVEKRGTRLKFTVDDGRTAVLEYDDPDPLAGDRVAVWTYDCGMMVARVRVAASEGGECEDVDVTPGEARCVYDE